MEGVDSDMPLPYDTPCRIARVGYSLVFLAKPLRRFPVFGFATVESVHYLFGDLTSLHQMIANRKLRRALAAGCFLLLILWLFFWLFIASRDSGRTTSITEVDGKRHEVSYDTAQRYRPYIPLVVLGVYGGVVGGVVSILVRRKPNAQRWLSAFVFSPGISMFSTVIGGGIFAFLTPSTFHPPDLSPAPRILQTLALVCRNIAIADRPWDSC